MEKWKIETYIYILYTNITNSTLSLILSLKDSGLLFGEHFFLFLVLVLFLFFSFRLYLLYLWGG